MMSLFTFKTVSCVMLILGLAVCQNGDFDVSYEGSGVASGDVEELTTTQASVIKKITTSKPDDTVDESGSGSDDEDPRLNATMRPSRLTTKGKSHVVVTDEDFSGSGSGYIDIQTTAAPKYTAEKKTKLVTITTKQATLASTESATTIGNKLPSFVDTEEPETTKRPVVTKGQNEIEDQDTDSVDIEVIHPGTTTVQPKSDGTTTLSNVITEGNTAINHPLNNVAAQKSTGENDPKQGLSFTTGMIIGVVVGAVLAILIILFLVHRLRKKDEGSYSLEEPITGYSKQEPGSPTSGKEYFA